MTVLSPGERVGRRTEPLADVLANLKENVS
jgi:hypothetical protein